MSPQPEARIQVKALVRTMMLFTAIVLIANDSENWWHWVGIVGGTVLLRGYVELTLRESAR